MSHAEFLFMAPPTAVDDPASDKTLKQRDPPAKETGQINQILPAPQGPKQLMLTNCERILILRKIAQRQVKRCGKILRKDGVSLTASMLACG